MNNDRCYLSDGVKHPSDSGDTRGHSLLPRHHEELSENKGVSTSITGTIKKSTGTTPKAWLRQQLKS